MALLAFAAPILPGKLEVWEAFAAELNGPRRADFLASRKKLGVRERAFLQQAPGMDVVIVTLEGEDPTAAMMGFGAGDDDFTNWFVKSVLDIHGFDLRQPPPGPPPALIIDSEELVAVK